MTAAQAAENHGDEWSLTKYLPEYVCIYDNRQGSEYVSYNT